MRRLTKREISRIKRLRYKGLLSSTEVAKKVGCSNRTVLHYAPGRPGEVRVDNARLREEVVQKNISFAELAKRIGWSYKTDRRYERMECGELLVSIYPTVAPDDTRVGRVLGVYGSFSQKNGTRYGPYFQKTLEYTDA